MVTVVVVGVVVVGPDTIVDADMAGVEEAPTAAVGPVPPGEGPGAGVVDYEIYTHGYDKKMAFSSSPSFWEYMPCLIKQKSRPISEKEKT